MNTYFLICLQTDARRSWQLINCSMASHLLKLTSNQECSVHLGKIFLIFLGLSSIFSRTDKKCPACKLACFLKTHGSYRLCKFQWLTVSEAPSFSAQIVPVFFDHNILKCFFWLQKRKEQFFIIHENFIYFIATNSFIVRYKYELHWMHKSWY